mgnify:CR=1 FL=1
MPQEEQVYWANGSSCLWQIYRLVLSDWGSPVTCSFVLSDSDEKRENDRLDAGTSRAPPSQPVWDGTEAPRRPQGHHWAQGDQERDAQAKGSYPGEGRESWGSVTEDQELPFLPGWHAMVRIALHFLDGRREQERIPVLERFGCCFYVIISLIERRRSREKTYIQEIFSYSELNLDFPSLTAILIFIIGFKESVPVKCGIIHLASIFVSIYRQ